MSGDATLDDLLIDGDVVTGSVAIDVSTWAKTDVRAAALDKTLGPALHDVAAKLKLTLAAAPRRYAFVRSGSAARNAEGKLVYDVRARIEGETLVPSRPPER